MPARYCPVARWFGTGADSGDRAGAQTSLAEQGLLQASRAPGKPRCIREPPEDRPRVPADICHGSSAPRDAGGRGRLVTSCGWGGATLFIASKQTNRFAPRSQKGKKRKKQRKRTCFCPLLVSSKSRLTGQRDEAWGPGSARPGPAPQAADGGGQGQPGPSAPSNVLGTRPALHDTHPHSF